MTAIDMVFVVLGVSAVAAPALLVLLLGGAALFRRSFSERATARLTQGAGLIGLVSTAFILFLMLVLGRRHVPIDVGNWVVISGPDEHFHFVIKLLFDRLSVPFSLLIFVLCGIIASFATSYLHRESGYRRFFLFFSLFQLGMILSAVAGTIETLFTGWELVGLSSAFLVAFFQDRPNPVRNGLRVWIVYRVADAAFLLAAIALHHQIGEGDFEKLAGGAASWPEEVAVILNSAQAIFVGLLLIVAAAGKSALIPFCGWLPRAMEGPTPSSAVFYGALSVHLGAYLLLRVSSLLAVTPWLWGTLIALGLLTSLYAAVTASVQSDIKGVLAFASLTQLGLIVTEIGLGAAIGPWGIAVRYLALVHMIGHACLRTLQFLRAPTLLRDYRLLENAIGSSLPHPPGFWERATPSRLRLAIYRLALDRGYLDSLLYRYAVHPFLSLFRWCDAIERRWISFLAGATAGQQNEEIGRRQGMRDLS
jgi:NAD(P)H-quinone oxidoreductase subunit 5